MMPIRALRMRNPSAGGAHDPFWSDVVFLAGFESGIIDESSWSHAVTHSTGSGIGSGTTSSNAKFGTSSYQQGNGDGFSKFPDGAEWPQGSAQFTVETFVNFTTIGTNCHIIGKWDTSSQGSWALSVFGGGLTLFRTANGSTQSNVTGTWSPSTGVWYHIAADFDGTKTRVYVDGVMKGSSLTAVSLFDSTAPFSIGSILTGGGANTDFRGYIDETRVTVGAARYASDAGFTAPTAAFPRS